MLKSHEKFHSANGKRLILVADDETINRELLGMVLQDDYEVIYAADGVETVEQVQKYREDLSLVLLDLMMPRKSGMEALRDIRSEPDLRSIPVIVLTADQNSEVESLSEGAIDYIPKPYPQADIILARIRRAIELSEDREIIQGTERDPLTGLYNREYFYRYAEQYDQHHRDREMDAIFIDVNHFHMINERFGTAFGDEVLKHIGQQIRNEVSDSDGIVCRRGGDTFMVYCPHGKDYTKILDNAAMGLKEGDSVNSRVRIRMGVYANVDKTLEIERRFDRAKMAADTVRNSFTRYIGIYDSEMHEQQLYAEQLIDDFHMALEEKQFLVYFQPKFDIRPQAPILASAEALVRWQHPKYGFISPGVFIPLFEENGLIQALDRYVWRRTAEQIQDWKKRFGFCVPISVNVSRVDMYDPDLLDRFEDLLAECGLLPKDMLLEITESAYTKDSEQIINTVNALRERGFRIEMDDFGTGYSSLNMISTLPIDALKLDMQFVRSAFQDQRDTRMLEVIIDIADHLNVPVIAEGVETEEQVTALKELGCDIVQGYYFSKPVSAEQFEAFLEARKQVTPEEAAAAGKEKKQGPKAKKGKPREKRPVKLRVINYAFVICTVVLALGLVLTDVFINRKHVQMDEATEKYEQASQAARDLEAGSDYLTVCVRTFVYRGEIQFLQNYFEEVHVTRRRENAVRDLESIFAGRNREAAEYLGKALEVSNALGQEEYQAMRMTQVALGLDEEVMPDEIRAVELPEEVRGLGPEEMHACAEELVFSDRYLTEKEQIRDYVALCTEKLITDTANERQRIRTAMDRMMSFQIVLLVLLLAAVAGEVLFVTMQIRIPLGRMMEQMRKQEKVSPQGAAELQFITKTYNEILEETQRKHSQLSFQASHDPLTGLYNRRTYDQFMKDTELEQMALLIIDVDEFKKINDSYGHDIGDRVLKKVSETLKHLFRSEDLVCRFGGDEFVVIMVNADSSLKETVINKINRANMILQKQDGLPPTTLSVGVAFSDAEGSSGDLFKDADTALYRVKESGRSGCAVF